ncbi:MAG: hypothetical protein RL154_491 [Pseudomonadota bacterium]|jgi:outer membrane protein TolC
MRALVCAAIISGALFAASSQEFIANAVNNNPDVVSMQKELEAAGYDKIIAGKFDNPILNVFVGNISQDQPLSRNIDQSQQINIGITQNIPLANRLSKKEALESAKISAISEKLNQKKLDIEFALQEQLYNISSLEAKKRVLEKYISNYNLLLALLNNYLASGTGSHIAIIKAEIEAQNVKNDIFNIDSELASARAKAASIANEPNIAIPLIHLEFENINIFKANEQQSPLLKQKQNEVTASSASYAIERSYLYPDIGVTVGYALADSKFNNYMFFGVTMPLPIYGRELAASARALKTQAQKQSELQATKNDLQFEQRRLKAKYENVKKSYDLYMKLSKSLGTHGLEIILSEVKSSKASQENAVSAINELLGFEIKLIDIKRESMLIKANLKKLYGEEI